MTKWILTLLLLMAISEAHSKMSCHIHPPQTNENKDIKIKLIGPFRKHSECDLENQRRFNGAGRCHCAFDNIFGDFPPSNEDSTPPPSVLP